MGDFLTAVSTVSLRSRPAAKNLIVEESVPESSQPRIRNSPTSAEEVLQILRSSPDADAIEDLLLFLNQPSQKSAGFDIKTPTASSAKVVNELINTTLTDFWNSSDQTNRLIIDCLRSVAGIGAVLAKLRILVSQHESTRQGVKKSDTTTPLSDLISVFSQLLNSNDLAQTIYADIDRLVDSQAKRTLLWKEYLALVGTGKIIASVAQAEDTVKSAGGQDNSSWLSDGSKYSAWMGRNVSNMIHQAGNNPKACKATAQLCGKALGIGYPVRVVEEIHTLSTFASPDGLPLLQSLLQNLQVHEQRQVLDQTLKILSNRCLPLLSAPDFDEPLNESSTTIAATSATITGMVGNSDAMRAHLETWLSDPVLNASESFSIRRAAVSAFVHSTKGSANMLEDPVQDLMEKIMKRFGDNLFVKHSPILQQEACAQILLLVAGYAHRAQPMSLFIMARSSAHLNGMSNRLNSSSPKARFLGMVVGMAISDLVDKSESKMNFDIDDMKTPEGKWYQHLVRVNDKFGNYTDIKNVFGNETTNSLTKSSQTNKSPASRKKPVPSKPKPKPMIQEEPRGSRIMEVLDDSEEDDDLVPYAKPDSDPEDEDEDPTMINRDKPKAPVYIRDLMAGLNDSENYDRHSLAVKNAAALIRRKASFGKEVSDHALELASILVGLGDTFDMEDFLELRLQALIAVLVSNPSQMAPWFARQVFDGDYSLSQRTTILSVLGLGARELAGYKDEDEDLNPKIAATAFPSKQLPERLHKLYAAERNAPLTRIASGLERAMIQPMALDAADKMSGPNILKVRTFSSRMEVERRKKVIPNALAKIVAEGFFFPLTGRWWQNLQAYGAENVHFQPFLLSTYLKTLSLILHAAGSGTISLPQMTAEFWELILSVRTNALADVSVLEAVLFATLTLLDMNEDKRRLAEEHSKQLIETQEWVELVFDRVGGADEEGERIRMLAASVLMKTREVVEKYQRLMVGDLVDY
ncbi:hypothetical protein D6D19_00705 [Aureobasidium pullulans]|uniref:Telomere length regulation protein conserved domain-containing protein n=1 Tax=Aureobasidium pullulans TaxID=5580 RepID=A0A4S9AL33_AURPU|nr:hypothetical protein D6D19_00705 [Aureobasidium pullulans]